MKRDTQLILACVCASVLSGMATTAGMALASRGGTGTYTLPTGNPVVTGTAISSTVHNNTMADLATEMTDSLNRSGKGAMLAGLQGYVGTVGNPGYTFAGDVDTGFYWVSANNFAASSNGAKVFQFGPTQVSSLVTVGIGAAVDTNGLVSIASGTGSGVLGTASGTGYGVVAQSDTTSPVTAAFRIVPQDAQPSGPNAVGDVYMTTAGVVKVCTVAGTPGTWVSVGAQ